MPTAAIVKLVFLILATILACIAVVIGKVVINKKNGGQTPYNVRKVVRIRMACFITMLVLLFICCII